MRRQFNVDGLIYEFEVSPNCDVCLAIIGGASPTFKPEYDPFDWHATAYVVDDIAASRQPVRVFRQAISLLYAWLGSKRPNYFTFTASTERKLRLYRRIALRIKERFGYSWHEDQSIFFFYKDAKALGDQLIHR